MQFVVAVVLGLALVACRSEPTCTQLIEDRRWGEAIDTCRAAYTRDGTPADGARLASALMYGNRLAEAGELAERLLPSGDPDAAYIAGVVARQRGDLLRAATLLGQAHDGHRGNVRKLARDAQQLAGVRSACGEYATALKIVDEGETAVQETDPVMLGYFELARVDLMRRLGDDVGAQQALQRAAPRLVNRDDLAWLEFKHAVVDLDARRYVLAEQRLRELRAQQLPPPLRAPVEIEYAWVADRAGRLDEAKQILAEVVDPSYSIEIAFGRAQNAHRRHQLDEARAYLEAIPLADLTDEWPWDVPLELGEIARDRGDEAGARAAFERAVAAIELQEQRDHRVLPSTARHRPYEALFTSYAREQRWDAALAVMIALDRTQLDVAHPLEVPWGSRQGVAQACSPVTSVPAPAEATADALVALARTSDVVIATMAGASLWRITIENGVPRGQAVADRAVATELVERVLAKPDDADAERALGDLLVPASKRTDALYVGLLGELSPISLAALRPAGTPLIETRPVSRLVPLGAQRARSEPREAALVLADPTSDLAAAREEGAWVAGHLAVAPLIGPAATKHALLASRPRIIHVAAHANLVGREPVLPLAGDAVGPTEIENHDWSATDLAVIASCGSAAAVDVEGRGSLAQALLRGGARMVLATLWSVEDHAAQQMIHAFYEAGGATDPVRALAVAQRKLASHMPMRQWAAFELLGQPVSESRSARQP